MNDKTKSNLYSLPSAKLLVNEIKKKRELRGISDEFVENALLAHLKKNNLSLPLSAKSEKLIIKDIRSYLRSKTGRFVSHEDTLELAEKHVSTKERLPSYKDLQDLVNRVHASSILDLGCGLNPLFLAKPGIKYYAYDIREDNIHELNSFFKKNNLPAIAKVADITKIDFPETDLCLILKVLDVIEIKGHKQSEILLKRIPSKTIIVSFSTKTLSGKNMNHPERGWIEQLCSRLGYKFTRKLTHNEIFYLIEKR